MNPVAAILSCSLPLLLAACQPGPPGATAAATPGTAPAPAKQPQALAGWYLAGRFQPCGGQALPVIDARELDRRLREQALSAADPVYVRAEARVLAGEAAITRVLQVGSPVPVRDCPMTGTSIAG